MRHRRFRSGALVAMVAVGSLLAVSGMFAQGQIGARKAWNPPRTPDGQPDIQGVWNFSTITPMERPANLGEFFTDQEIAERQRQATVAATTDQRSPDAAKDVQTAYDDSVWWERGTRVMASKRTSLLVDPPDGQLPPLTPGAEAREAARAKARQHPAGPEDFELKDRCIVGFNQGPPMLPNAYNNNVQLVQSRDHVVIVNEMVHDARMVPLDGRPHIGAAIRQMVGDSRGQWDGNTLVVDTTNFTDEGLGLFKGGWGFRGTGDRNLHVIERFTRLDTDVLRYEARVDDPTTYTKPWTVSLLMTRSPDKIYEYACHEGNFSIANMLSAERATEH